MHFGQCPPGQTTHDGEYTENELGLSLVNRTDNESYWMMPIATICGYFWSLGDIVTAVWLTEAASVAVPSASKYIGK